MDAIFIKVAYQKDMMKYKVEGEEKWGACSSAVKKYASSNFSEGDKCNITVDGEKEGMTNITRVEKVDAFNSCSALKTKSVFMILVSTSFGFSPLSI